MKKIIVVLLLLIANIGFSQDIKIKKDIVYVDGKECLKIGGDANNVSFYDLEGNEIIFLKYIHNSKYGSLYNKITFLKQKKSFTSQSYIFTKNLLMKKLIGDKTLINCLLDEDKIENFITKYDENIEKPNITVEIKTD